MFRKVSNKLLGIVLLILVVAAILIFIVDSGKNERTFKEILVNIDTLSVSEILIFPKSKNHEEVRLFKENENWEVALSGEKKASVSNKRMTDLFNQLLAIKPTRLAARGKDKWNEFQVDSTGSRVKVMQGDKLVLDLVIGRFIFQQPRSMSTCVRLFNDNDVYVVDGFLDMTFNQGAEIFRDGTIVNDDINNWNQLQFNYPDSSFTLSKSGNDWFINGVRTDSTKTANYFNRLSKLSGSKYFDEYSSNDLTNPFYKLKITTSDLKFIEIKGQKINQQFLISSSQNPEAVFDASSIGFTIFTGSSDFLSK